MANVERDLMDDLIVEGEEPLPSPDSIMVEQGSERNQSNFSTRISTLIQMILAFILYAYVIMNLFHHIIIPSSINPLVHHESSMLQANDTNVRQLVLDICQNGLLMLLFFLQHIIMTNVNIELILEKFNMSYYSRAVYVLMTCIVLEVINWLWKSTPNYYIWHCQHTSTFFFIAMATIHSLCWLFLGFSLVITDHLDFFGIKHVFKSGKQREFQGHLHHPCFLSPLVILWAVPTMTYDRLLLAVMVPLFLIWGSDLTNDDVLYVKEMYDEKKKTLFNKKLD
jgi:hypothetical protein